MTGETILESNYDAGTIWCRRDSVWSRYYEGNLCLYPDSRHFAKTELTAGGVLTEKYVRAEGVPFISYENWSDMREGWEFPYAGRETFETILSLYENVNMSGEYEQGEKELYPIYLDAFYKLICRNALVTDLESGESVMLSELSFFERPLYPVEDGEDAYQPELYKYYFFDMDGDGAPELTIYQRAVGFVVFDYDLRTDSYRVWYDAQACWYVLAGSQKVLWTWDGGTYMSFYELDGNGVETGETFCLSRYYNGEQELYLVMLPKSAGDAGDGGGAGLAITEEMKAEGMYSLADGQWYFRVTGEQYEQITEQYRKAYESAGERMDREAYTYEELFGGFARKAGFGLSSLDDRGQSRESFGGNGAELFDAGSGIGARIIARRVSWEEVSARAMCDKAEEGNYILFEDLDSGRQCYLPDRYGEISDIQVTESGICIRDREVESGLKAKPEAHGTPREHWVPGCFVFPFKDVMPLCGGVGGYSDTVFLTGKEEADALPQRVWKEAFDAQGGSLLVAFERVSPIYHEGFSESEQGYMADYRLTVTDVSGAVLSEQRIAGYPVAYEQVHWLIDFSGDGFPDLAFCTSMIDGTYYHSAQTHFLIWDEEVRSYVVKPLPEPENVPRITGFVNWDSEMSAVWTDMDEDEYGNEVYGMFAYRDGGWKLIRSMEQVYSEGNQQSDPSRSYGETLCYRELLYADGEPAEERMIAPEDIWDRKKGRLYPRDGWTWEEREVGGIRIGWYYVRE